MLKIILPSFFAIAAFIISIFLFLIPRVESIAVSQKKKGIERLVTLNIQILDHFQLSYRSGSLTLAEAREQAARIITEFRYGRNMKDYFWIINTEPRVIAHPYRPDLEGTYVGDYKDERGRALFIEMVDLTKQHGEGYVRYLWQLREEEQIIAEKLSFVKRYEPWDWIVGTGIYLQELEREIAGITKSMTIVSLCVTFLVTGFLVYIIRQGISIGQAKAHAENKYKFLVEFMKEGLLIQDRQGRFAFVNDSFCSMLGYRKDELLGQPLIDFIRPGERNFFRKQIETRRKGGSETYQLNWVKKSGDIFNSIVSPKPLFTPEGEYDGSFGAVTDITLMQRMLDEKTLLLNEIHHRVKNNLQLISSLLNLQKSESAVPLVRRHLTETQNRIQTMAMVHDSLYQSEQFENIAFDAFIQQLALSIQASSVEFCTYNIDMDLPTKPVFIDVAKAIPAGLIVQELLSIPLNKDTTDKLTADDSLNVMLKLKNEDPRVSIAVLYNTVIGIGNNTRGGPLGIELINILVEQIGGKIKVTGHAGGTEITVTFMTETK